MGRRRRTRAGQALVEFAIALPVLAILIAGVLEMGRGYSFAVATSDAARDAARYVAGKTSSTNGQPGAVGARGLAGYVPCGVASGVGGRDGERVAASHLEHARNEDGQHRQGDGELNERLPGASTPTATHRA